MCTKLLSKFLSKANGGWYHQMMKAREGESPESFINYFVKRGIEKEFAKRFYREFQINNNLGQLPIRPHDRICEDLGICEEDFVIMSLKMMESMGRQKLSKETRKSCPSVKSVADMLSVIYNQPYLSQ